MSKSFFAVSTVCLIIILGYLLSPSVLKNKQQPEEIIFPQVSPTISPTPSPLPTVIENTQEKYQQFIYPNSKVLEKDENEIVLESIDDTGVVTNWYKEKVKEMGMNSTAFSQTNTNGNIFNNLSASNGLITIEVTIKKTSNQSKTLVYLVVSY